MCDDCRDDDRSCAVISEDEARVIGAELRRHLPEPTPGDPESVRLLIAKLALISCVTIFAAAVLALILGHNR